MRTGISTYAYRNCQTFGYRPQPKPLWRSGEAFFAVDGTGLAAMRAGSSAWNRCALRTEWRITPGLGNRQWSRLVSASR